MYIIETGLKTGSFVNIMEIENKHIEDLIYSYLMGDISEEGRNEYYNGWKRMTLINSAFPRWQIVGRRRMYLCLPLI